MIELEDAVRQGDEVSIGVETANSDSVLYFLANTQGNIIASDVIELDNADNDDSSTDKTMTDINISSEISKKLGIGANSIKIFAISESVLKPDFYESSFIVTANDVELPQSTQDDVRIQEEQSEYQIVGMASIVIITIIIFGIIVTQYKRKKNQKERRAQH